MVFKSARCPNCSGELSLDPSVKKGFCMHCGSEIIVEEAIKKVQVDGVASIDNLFTMAEMARGAGNFEEAYGYYTKTLELDPNHYKARYERSLIAGFESIYTKSRLDEALKGIEISIKNAPENEKEDIKIKAATDLQKLASYVFDRAHKQHISYKLVEKSPEGWEKLLNDYLDFIIFSRQIFHILELSSIYNPDLKTQNLKMIVEFANKCRGSKQYLGLNLPMLYGMVEFTATDEELVKYIEGKNSEIVGIDSSYIAKAPKGNCYIATAVYDDYNAPEVIVLRNFRDNVMSKTIFGRGLIELYYYLSPSIAINLANRKSISNIIRIILNTIVNNLR